MTRLFVILVPVLWVGEIGQSQPKAQGATEGKARPAPPVKLESGKAILKAGERLILPKGTVISKKQVTGEAELEVGFLRLIPAKKGKWKFEIRPVGRKHLRIKPERGALDGVRVIFAGFRGQLLDDTTLSKGFLWLKQPYEIRDRTGKVVFTTEGKGKN